MLLLITLHLWVYLFQIYLYYQELCEMSMLIDEKIVKLLSEMGGIFKVLLGILCSLSVMLIIGITLVIKISNSGMMYR